MKILPETEMLVVVMETSSKLPSQQLSAAHYWKGSILENERKP